jgi:hypothetical protein
MVGNFHKLQLFLCHQRVRGTAAVGSIAADSILGESIHIQCRNETVDCECQWSAGLWH